MILKIILNYKDKPIWLTAITRSTFRIFNNKKTRCPFFYAKVTFSHFASFWGQINQLSMRNLSISGGVEGWICWPTFLYLQLLYWYQVTVRGNGWLILGILCILHPFVIFPLLPQISVGKILPSSPIVIEKKFWVTDNNYWVILKIN